MAARYFRVRLAFAITLGCVLELPAVCSAQQPDPNGPPNETHAAQDSSGCPQPAALWPLPSATLMSCEKADSVGVILPLSTDAHGVVQEKRVRGVYEFREYKIPQSDQDYAFDRLMDQLPMAGFKIKYSMKPSTITARKGDTWILINVSGDLYNVSVVQEPPEVWTSVKTAEEISREMQAHNHVDIYGIAFSSADQSILEKRSQILFEILKYLKQNPNLSVVVESHKISTQGPPESDSEITRVRANAVMDWLIAHGIARVRMQPRAFGRDNPLTDNESPSQIQRNERIALAKTAS
jgi:outer membrane protein OmpA-like peptidoglycan-associated protein